MNKKNRFSSIKLNTKNRFTFENRSSIDALNLVKSYGHA